MSIHRTKDCGKKHEYLHLRPLRSNKIRFSVRAPKDASICLSSDTRSGTKTLYEIIIGGCEGTKSWIDRGKDCGVVSVSTPGILSSREFRSFWITSHNGFLKVGKQFQEEPFLSVEDTGLLRDVKYYGYCTSWGASGDWTFSD